VLTSSPKKPKRRIEDISMWLEAFSMYCLVLVSHFPNRWKDLLQYQLLILRTHRQFTGQVWLSYDRVFRENAAATNLTDWSQLNITLFSFHSARWSARSPRDAMDSQNEPHGAASSQIICRSWTLCGPFFILLFCSQVCQLPRPAPRWILPGRNAQQANLVIQASS